MARPLYWLRRACVPPPQLLPSPWGLRACVRHRHLVLALWVLVALVLVALAKHAGSETNDNLTLPGSGSQNATDLLTKRFPLQANGTNPVVLEAPAGAKLSDKQYADAVAST